MATLLSSSVTSWANNDPLTPTVLNSKMTPLIADIAVLNNWIVNPLVAPWSAAGDGATDDTATLQAMINFYPSNAIFDGQWHTYRISAPLVFPAGATRIHFRNFQFSVSGDVGAISAAGLVFDATFENIFITATAHTTSGRKLIDYTNFALTTWKHIRTFGTLGVTTHWYGTGNGAGSAPYYNLWEQCYGGVGLIYLHSDDNGTPASGPNANTMTASRIQMASNTAFVVGRYSQAWQFNSVIIETALSGYSIDGISNTIRGGWLESCSTAIAFGPNAVCNLVDSPYISSTNTRVTGAAGYERLNAVDSVLNDVSDVQLLATRKPTYYATQSASTTPPFAFASELSLGLYRSEASVMAQTYGALSANGWRSNLTTVTANYTATINDNVIVTNSASTVTITLPNPSTVTGQLYNIKRRGTGASILTAASAASIDDQVSISIPNQYQSYFVQSYGTGYVIL